MQLTQPLLSLARSQRSLIDPRRHYPLHPVLTDGELVAEQPFAYPLEVDYDYAQVNTDLFFQAPLPGLERWSALLPPLLPGLSLGEGGTPLLETPTLASWAGIKSPVFVKDESRNPTASHKDRLNLCTVSAAALEGAPGIVATSSGNHAVSAAAYAARAGLSAVVFVRSSAAPTVRVMLRGLGAAVLEVQGDPIPVMRAFAERYGLMPVSSTQFPHIGHPFGSEGYKTIAYELFAQLGHQAPSGVLIPTGYAEMLYGVSKGFRELRDLGLIQTVPPVFACEPAARAPLHHALERGVDALEVPAAPTVQFATGVTWNGYRGVRAVRDSGGAALLISDQEVLEAQTVLAHAGLWQEDSAAAGAAGLRQLAGRAFDRPLVVIACSSGLKNPLPTGEILPSVPPNLEAVVKALQTNYGGQTTLMERLEERR